MIIRVVQSLTISCTCNKYLVCLLSSVLLLLIVSLLHPLQCLLPYTGDSISLLKLLMLLSLLLCDAPLESLLLEKLSSSCSSIQVSLIPLLSLFKSDSPIELVPLVLDVGWKIGAVKLMPASWRTFSGTRVFNLLTVFSKASRSRFKLRISLFRAVSFS